MSIVTRPSTGGKVALAGRRRRAIRSCTRVRSWPHRSPLRSAWPVWWWPTTSRGDAGGLVLVVLWAGAGLALGLRRREDRLAPIAFAAALLGGAWLLMAGLATGDDSFVVDLGVRLAAALLPALAFHLLVSLPDGRLVTQLAGRASCWRATSSASASAVVLMSDRDELLVWPLALAWLAALGLGLVASHGRYREAGAVDRRRMQWIGWALAVGAEVVLVIVALEVLADWPDAPGHRWRWRSPGSCRCR